MLKEASTILSGGFLNWFSGSGVKYDLMQTVADGKYCNSGVVISQVADVSI